METIQERLKQGKFSLIAEIGVNYYDIADKLKISPLEAAKMMVLSAKNAGIHAVKFQTYKAETLASKNSPSYWDTSEESTKSQYLLFKKFDSFGVNEYIELKKFCNQVDIEFCSTPFDFDSVDYLYELMSFYKISSSDLSNIPFITYIAKKNKPILLSVGASNLDEIRSAVDIIHRYNDKKLTLLHCVLEYPTPYTHANLAKITSLKSTFPDVYVGYSDHTKTDGSYNVLKTAYLLGAQIIEKHFTLDKKLTGNDHYHAMDAHDAEEILKEIEFIDTLKGNSDLVCLKTEQSARTNARRSIVSNVDILKGTKITEKMVTFKRPGTGISPMDINKLIGKIAKETIKEDTILQWEMVKTDDE